MQANAGVPDGKWYCTVCRGRFERPGDCPSCPSEPLLDLSNEEVRRLLEEQDATVRRKRQALLTGVSAVLASPVLIGLAVLCDRTATPATAAFFGAAVFAMGLTWVLMRAFPPLVSAPKLTQADLLRWSARTADVFSGDGAAPDLMPRTASERLMRALRDDG